MEMLIRRRYNMRVAPEVMIFTSWSSISLIMGQIQPDSWRSTGFKHTGSRTLCDSASRIGLKKMCKSPVYPQLWCRNQHLQMSCLAIFYIYTVYNLAVCRLGYLIGDISGNRPNCILTANQWVVYILFSTTGLFLSPWDFEGKFFYLCTEKIMSLGSRNIGFLWILGGVLGSEKFKLVE